MTKATKYGIGAGVLGALAVLIGLTVANKSWWKRRIDAKWKYQSTRNPENPTEWGYRGWSPDMSKYSYAQLVRWYLQGDEGWFQTAEEGEEWFNSLATVTEGQ